jgi:TPR repeat protein
MLTVFVALSVLAGGASEATSEDDVKTDEGRCTGGEAAACTRLSIDYENGFGATRDVARAAEYAELSRAKMEKAGPPCPRCLRCARRELDPSECAALCEHLDGDVRVCPVVAASLEEQEPERARILADRGCRAGVAASCTLLARLWESGRGGGTDLGQAASLRQQACGAGDSTACAELGLSLLQAAKKPNARGLRLLAKGCAGSHWLACDALALAYTKGAGVPHDDARAAVLYGRGCEGNAASAARPASCLALADLLSQSPSPDASRVRWGYRQACEGGLAEACSRVTAQAR